MRSGKRDRPFWNTLPAINERRFRNGASEEKKSRCACWWPPRMNFPKPTAALKRCGDRMPIRLWLDKVQDKSNFRSMLISQQDENEKPGSRFTAGHGRGEYQQWQVDIGKITLPDAVFELIHQLRQQLDLLPSAPYVSDRRWKKAIRLLQASALFSGCDAVALSI